MQYFLSRQLPIAIEPYVALVIGIMIIVLKGLTKYEGIPILTVLDMNVKN